MASAESRLATSVDVYINGRSNVGEATETARRQLNELERDASRLTRRAIGAAFGGHMADALLEGLAEGLRESRGWADIALTLGDRLSKALRDIPVAGPLGEIIGRMINQAETGSPLFDGEILDRFHGAVSTAIESQVSLEELIDRLENGPAPTSERELDLLRKEAGVAIGRYLAGRRATIDAEDFRGRAEREVPRVQRPQSGPSDLLSDSAGEVASGVRTNEERDAEVARIEARMRDAAEADARKGLEEQRSRLNAGLAKAEQGLQENLASDQRAKLAAEKDRQEQKFLADLERMGEQIESTMQESLQLALDAEDALADRRSAVEVLRRRLSGDEAGAEEAEIRARFERERRTAGDAEQALIDEQEQAAIEEARADRAKDAQEKLRRNITNDPGFAQAIESRLLTGRAFAAPTDHATQALAESNRLARDAMKISDDIRNTIRILEQKIPDLTVAVA